MRQLFALAVISVASLLLLGLAGIQTGFTNVDLWVGSILSIL